MKQSEAWELYNKAGSKVLEELVIELAEFASIDEQLITTAKDVATTMERLIARVDEGGRLNSLGELQGRGPELDRLCATREAQSKNVVHMAARLVRWGLATMEEVHSLLEGTPFAGVYKK